MASFPLSLTFFALGAPAAATAASLSAFPLLSASSEQAASAGSFMNSSAMSNLDPTSPFICW